MSLLLLLPYATWGYYLIRLRWLVYRVYRELLVCRRERGAEMVENEVYDFIGDLAIALYSKKIQITLSALNRILEDRGWGYGNNRGLASGVSASCRYWEKKDPVIHHAIAYSYLNRNGQLPWK